MSQINETTYELFVSYSQIAVFDGGFEEPFNDWTPQHVQQGFSWRDGSVSFKTLMESGHIKVEINRQNRFSATASSMRTISVPFVCQESAQIEIATVTESYPIHLEPGDYQLVYETGWDDVSCWCLLTFVKDGVLEPQILNQDDELKPIFPLLMHADPA